MTKTTERKAQVVKTTEKRKSNYSTNGIKQQWQDYNKHNPTEKLTLVEYSSILKEYNKRVADRLIQGEKFKLDRLGDIFVKRIECDYNKPRIDWNKSKLTGKKVYMLDDYYPLIHWRKKKRKSNHTFYKYIPARGKDSIVKRLNIAFNTIPLQQLKYVKPHTYKYIEQRSMNGDLITTYLTLEDVIKKNPTMRESTIKSVANNPSRSAYKYRWNYVV